jgi:hypothetical protein
VADDSAPLDNHVTVVSRGSSTKAAQKAALDALPLDKLVPENRQRVEKLLRAISVDRELPTLSFEVDPHVYSFFLSRPDVAVSIWRAMNISNCQLWQTGALTYEADAGDGSYGALEVIHRSVEHNLVLCQGVFKSPLLVKPVKADALIHLQTTFLRDLDGKTHARHRGHLFVSFPSLTVGAAAKLMSPVNNLIIDRNFEEISAFLHMMSIAMERNPQWVEQIAGQLDGVVEVRKNELAALTEQVNGASRQRGLPQDRFLGSPVQSANRPASAASRVVTADDRTVTR